MIVETSGPDATAGSIPNRSSASGIADPSSIIEAQLDLVVSQNSRGSGSLPYTYTVEVFGLNDGGSETWVEGNGGADNSPAGEITWNNAPASNNDNTFTSGATSLGSFTLTTNADGDLVGQVYSLNNAALLSFFNADTDGLATIMLRRTDGSGSNNLSFASKEHTTLSAPQMTLTIPEPATICLVSLGLIGTCFRRRRAA